MSIPVVVVLFMLAAQALVAGILAFRGRAELGDVFYRRFGAFMSSLTFISIVVVEATTASGFPWYWLVLDAVLATLAWALFLMLARRAQSAAA
jgi:hypothetical protein